MKIQTAASISLAIAIAVAAPSVIPNAIVVAAQQQQQPATQATGQINTPPEQKEEKKRGVFGSIFGRGSRSKKDSTAPADSPSATTTTTTTGPTLVRPTASEAQQQTRPRTTTTGSSSGVATTSSDTISSTATAADAATTTTEAAAATTTSPSDAAVATMPADDVNRHQVAAEDEAAIVPYYNNFMSNYRLGPEDVISITVFGLERYNRVGIVIPPDGMIAHPLIPQGIRVVGKTREQVQSEVKKHFDEMINEPMVTVSIDQSRSMRFSVIGDVAAPGIKPMNRRLSVYEAIGEAGGVLNTGNKKKVVVLRRQANGTLMQIPVDLAAIEKGKQADLLYLVSGDQVIVPGNTLKKVKEVLGYVSILSFANIFRGGGF